MPTASTSAKTTSLPPRPVVWSAPAALVGLSTHEPAQLTASLNQPVDYISAGPVTPTPTKPGRPGMGLAYIAAATGAARVPVWVTGGVDPVTVDEMARAGARHFVVVRWLTEADEPETHARALRQAIDRAVDQAIDRAVTGKG